MGGALFRAFGATPAMTLRPASMGQTDFAANAYIFSMRGRVKTVAPQQITPGEDAPLQLTYALDYFRGELDGEELFEIDVENGRRVIGGVDQLADLRRAMGI